MFCNKARNWINLERDGMLPADKLVALEKHLDSCAECRAYREDLATMNRLLGAADAEPPANFEWKLQLRLNRALRQAADDGATPWVAPRNDSLRWLRGFGAAAVVGLAASIALAVFVLPGGGVAPASLDPAVASLPSTSAERTVAVAGETRSPSAKGGPAAGTASISPVNRSAGDPDRRTLSLFTRPGSSRGGLLGRQVSVAGGSAPTRYQGMAGIHNRADLEMISRLSRENSLLRAEISRLRLIVGQEEALNDSTNSALLESVGTE